MTKCSGINEVIIRQIKSAFLNKNFDENEGLTTGIRTSLRRKIDIVNERL